ncbi:MAG: RNA polymerase sigma factor [Planctomycetaceae bacterium]
MALPRTTRVSLFQRIGDDPQGTVAWGDFVATYGPTVVQWCRRHGLQDADAHDVAQNVLVRFWRHAATFRYDPSQRFRAYLRRMVVTAVSDWSRSRREDRLATGACAVQEVLSSVPAREELVRRVEEVFDLELLEAAMQEVEVRVQPRTWQAFRLQAIEQVPAEEVARRLGMTVGNAYRAKSVILGLLRRRCADVGVAASRLEMMAP